MYGVDENYLLSEQYVDEMLQHYNGTHNDMMLTQKQTITIGDIFN